jgi:hypothetical protein
MLKCGLIADVRNAFDRCDSPFLAIADRQKWVEQRHPRSAAIGQFRTLNTCRYIVDNLREYASRVVLESSGMRRFLLCSKVWQSAEPVRKYYHVFRKCSGVFPCRLLI